MPRSVTKCLITSKKMECLGWILICSCGFMLNFSKNNHIDIESVSQWYAFRDVLNHFLNNPVQLVFRVA